MFWHVDIGCLSDRHVDGSDIKATYHWPRIFKMWIDVVKDFARGVDRVDELGAYIGRWADVAAVHGTQAEKLARYLDLCAERARTRGAPYEELYRHCADLGQTMIGE